MMAKPIVLGPLLPISPTQEAARGRVAAAINSGRWSLIANRCCCGSSGGGDIPVASEDRYGLPFPQTMCCNCGVIRSEVKFAPDEIGEFYDIEYRSLYSGSRKAEQSFFDDQYKTGSRFVRDFLEKIPADHRGSLLEIGCGAGGILKAIGEAGWGPVTGVDLGGDYLEFGRNAGLTLIQGDYRTHIPNGSQQLIVLSHVLEHLLDPVQALREMKEKLRPGGYLLIEVPGILNLHRSYDYVYHYFQGAHIYNFSLAHIALMLEITGFQVVSGNECATVLARNVGHAEGARLHSWKNPRLVKKVLHYLRLLALGESVGLPSRRLRGAKSFLKRGLPKL